MEREAAAATAATWCGGSFYRLLREQIDRLELR